MNTAGWLFGRSLKTGCVRMRRRGFTLIEVVFSLGIASFALISLLGLIPVGLKTFQEATSTMVQSQIFQQIVSEAQQLPFQDLGKMGQTGYFFDDQGILQTAQNGNSMYEAKVTVTNALNTPILSTSNLTGISVSIQKIGRPDTVVALSTMIANNGLK